MKRRISPLPLLLCLLLGALLSACSESSPSSSSACPGGASLQDGRCVFPTDILVGPVSLGPARVNVPFEANFEAVGGRAPYTYRAEGDLPSGLSLSEGGALTGTPLEEGEFSFALLAVDADGSTGGGTVSVAIRDTGEEVCEPSEEVCDGLDNDCDGQVDEGCSACEPSEEVCDGADNDCDGEIDEGCPACEPSEEVCDGLDNDCDGEIDEGCPVCEPSEEVCDGLDNDCDGVVDEDVQNACGACGDAPEEVCDGTDNDCDGEVDEGCACVPGEEEACGIAVGACEAGTRRCEGGVWGACLGSVAPQGETCDGLDNDCDGEIDEDLGDLGDCSSTNDLGSCRGSLRCVEGAAVCLAPEASEEVCDGVDNDCDGEVDEDRNGQALERSCRSRGCEVLGVSVCERGEWGLCEFPEEVCDGLDNNCDGLIDNDVPNEGDTCGGTEFCAPGALVCRGGEMICDGADGGFPEVCDGFDNDCDGEIDEEVEEGGATCLAEGCVSGAFACVDGVLSCEPTGEVFQPGELSFSPVETSLVRAYTGTTDFFQSPGGSSYSILVTSDGERIYNVAYGINGQSFAGWTVKIFVPSEEGLLLQEEVQIRASWQEQGMQQLGFAGAAARDGRIYVLNTAASFSGGGIWEIDPDRGSAQVYRFWEGRSTFEAGAEYDWARGRFWTIPLNGAEPTVYRYGDGLNAVDEEDGFVLDTSEIGDDLGTIASDGTYLYAANYNNQIGSTTSIWRFGSGFAGTTPGEFAGRFGVARGSASMTFHNDGFLYVPDQNNPSRIQRLAVRTEAEAEVCDGIDNDCNGQIDEGVCEAAVDLEVTRGEAYQSQLGFQEITVDYIVTNLGGGEAGAHQDHVRLVDFDQPNINIALLGVLERDGFGPFESRRYQETFEIPEGIESGEYKIAVIQDAEMSIGDENRPNNLARLNLEYEAPSFCVDDDRFEPNDTPGEGRVIARTSFYSGLAICRGGEEDWFYLDVPRRSGQSLLFQYESDTGDEAFEVEVYNSASELVAESTDAGLTRLVRFTNSSNRTRRFWIRVFFPDGSEGGRVNYSLTTGAF